MLAFFRTFWAKPRHVRFGWLLLILAIIAGFSYANRHALRYITLPAFDPHREEFTCLRYDDVAPPLDPEANQWFEQGNALISEDKPEDKRDYQAAAALWTKAAQRKHWKAQEALANLYLNGPGVALDREKALQLIEDAMAWGEPHAWNYMAVYHGKFKGGLSQDWRTYYAFIQKAAEMGEPQAQTQIGENLLFPGDNDEIEGGNNNKIGFQMLECALAQGHGEAGRKLGLAHTINKAVDARQALGYFHAGVRFGDASSADTLRSTFKLGSEASFPAPFVDFERVRRYTVFSAALHDYPELRFPNLDKIVPLPPAKLPDWDGNREHLLIAALAPGIKPPEPKPVDVAKEKAEHQRMLEELISRQSPELQAEMNKSLKKMEQEPEVENPGK